MARNEALARFDDYFLKGAFEADLARRVTFRTESNLKAWDRALERAR